MSNYKKTLTRVSYLDILKLQQKITL